MNFAKKIKNILIKYYWIIILLIIIIPFVATIFFSVPSADDFSMAKGVLDNTNSFLRSIRVANNFYLTWAGGWPYNLLQCLLNPLSYTQPHSSLVGISLVAFFVIFIVVVYKYFMVILNKVLEIKNKQVCSIIYLIFIAVLLNTNIYPEIFYWFVGNSYLWEVTFILVCQILVIYFFREKRNIGLIVATTLFAFIACFAYQLAPFAGIVCLFEMWNYYKRGTKKINIIDFLPLIAMIVGACISCFAPGNFARHTEIDSTGVHFGQALISSIANMEDIYLNFIKSILFIIVFVILLIAGYIIKDKTERKFVHPVFMWLGQFASVFCVIFPIALGYSDGDIPNRMFFLINCVICIWSFICATYTGAWIKQKTILFSTSECKKIIVGLCLGAVCCLILCKGNSGNVLIEELPWLRTTKSIADVKQESDYYKEILSNIQGEPNTDVEVYINDIEKPVETGIIKPPQLSTDKESWVNKDMSHYYGFNSLTFIYK